jgi:hypothetical protein
MRYANAKKTSLILRTNSWQDDDVLQATEKANLVVGRFPHCEDSLY